MRRLIQRLREKPPKVRHRVALGTSAVITTVIFVGWVTVISQGFFFTEPGQPETQTASPLSAFGDNASAVYSEFSESFPEYWSGTSSKEMTGTTSPKTETDSPSGVRTQRVEQAPYWEANEKQSQSQKSNQEGFWENPYSEE